MSRLWDTHAIEEIQDMMGIYTIKQIAKILNTTTLSIEKKIDAHQLQHKTTIYEDSKLRLAN